MRMLGVTFEEFFIPDKCAQCTMFCFYSTKWWHLRPDCWVTPSVPKVDHVFELSDVIYSHETLLNTCHWKNLLTRRYSSRMRTARFCGFEGYNVTSCLVLWGDLVQRGSDPVGAYFKGDLVARGHMAVPYCAQTSFTGGKHYGVMLASQTVTFLGDMIS